MFLDIKFSLGENVHEEMIGKSFDVDVGDIFGVPEEAFRNILILNIDVDLSGLDGYVDEDEVVVVGFGGLGHLSEVVTDCNDVEFVEGFVVGVYFFAVFDVSLHEAMRGVVEL